MFAVYIVRAASKLSYIKNKKKIKRGRRRRKIYKIKRKRKERRKAQGDILAYDDNDQRINSRIFSPFLSRHFYVFIYNLIVTTSVDR